MKVDEIISKDPRTNGERMRASRDFAEGYILGQLGTVAALVMAVEVGPFSEEHRRKFIRDLREIGKEFEKQFDQQTASAGWRNE